MSHNQAREWHEHIAQARAQLEDDARRSSQMNRPLARLRDAVVGAWNGATQLVIECLEPGDLDRMINAYAKLVVRIEDVDCVKGRDTLLKSWPKKTVSIRFQKAIGASALEAALEFARRVLDAAGAMESVGGDSINTPNPSAQLAQGRFAIPATQRAWHVWANIATQLVPSLVLLLPATSADQFKAEAHELGRTIADEEVEAIKPLPKLQAVGGRDSTTKDSPKSQMIESNETNSWIFLPGGFQFLGHKGILSGKPLRCLKAMVDIDGPVTFKRMLTLVWKEGKVSEKAVHAHLSKARAAIKAALSLPPDFDPMPAVDRGQDLAWEFRRDEIQKLVQTRK